MKNLILIFIFLSTNTIIAQEYFDFNKISSDINKCKKERINKSYIIKFNGLAKIPYDEPLILEKITSINKKHFTTVIGFKSKENSEDLYLPINDNNFNLDYYRENIEKKLNQANPFLEVIIKINIYKTDSIPIILVESMKLYK